MTVDAWGCLETILDEDGPERGGPLAGVRFAVKSNLAVAGAPLTAGTAITAEVPERSAAVVRALEEAGAVAVATTTMAEAAIGSVTINPWTGVCTSPADPTRNAGGSSGGSAAAVAAGLVRFALGSDTMGSVRIPAACCGVLGWKPTHGGISTDGLVPLSSVLDTVGVLAASVDDLTAVADVVADPSVVDAAVEGPTRVAPLGLDAPWDEAASRAVSEALTRLQETGVDVVASRSLSIDPPLVRRRGLLLCEVEGAQVWAEALEADDPGLSPPVKDLLRYGANASPERVAAAQAVRTDVRERALLLFDDVDVLVLPTLAGPPPYASEDPPSLADLTAWVNLAGLPAVCVPTSVVADGEVVARSVQLVGAPGSDRRLLRLAAAVHGAGT